LAGLPRDVLKALSPMGNTFVQSAQANEPQQWSDGIFPTRSHKQKQDTNALKSCKGTSWAPAVACGGGFCGVLDEFVVDDGHGQAPWMRDELAPVTLHVYDVGTSLQIRALNGVLRRVGTGFFHCGVEVFGSEWSYSDVLGEECGIFCCPPCRCEGYKHVESIYMGRTALTVTGFRSIINSMQSFWSSEAYHLLAQNCCHFCEDLCAKLGVGNIPHWINHLANTCAMVTDPAENDGCPIKCCAAEILLCGSGSERPVLLCSTPSGADIPGGPTCFATIDARDGRFEEEASPQREMTVWEERFKGTLDRFKRQGSDVGPFAEQDWQANHCTPPMYFT